jgi:hypothetical protein
MFSRDHQKLVLYLFFLHGSFDYSYVRLVISFTVKDFLPISGLPEHSEADGLTNGKRE